MKVVMQMNNSDIHITDTKPSDIEQVCALYDVCYKTKPRPTHDKARIKKMIDNASFIYTAWYKDRLVGYCRCLSDFTYVSYISDIMVHPEFQRQGIGATLIEYSKTKIGPDSRLSLLSNIETESYYEKLGFKRHPRAWDLDI
jgi:ribosomal protein S18 acetylase RimI-like enzyme